jgi:pimeloyl-ACP methyl ester carboxylesterase
LQLDWRPPGTSTIIALGPERREACMSGTLSTVRGATRLTFDSVEGIVNTVEQMHETIARRPLPFTRRTAGRTRAHGLIASSVYSIIRGVNATLREGVDLSMRVVPERGDERSQSREKATWLAAVNGVCGDHLEATGNTLAIDMHLSTPEYTLDLDAGALAATLPDASPHLVVFVHGLCLSPFSWRRRGEPSIGDTLAAAFAVTPLYLGYNSGRHISSNGRELAATLSRLCAAWPVPVESLSLVGHSMGGLVIRSACWYAGEAGEPWLEHLARIVCLGTPHHGAALEKAGSLFDRSMQAIQYVDPLLFGKHRSVGIKDLRHGNLLDEDWQVAGVAGDSVPYEDTRRPVPLMDDVHYYFVAATIGRDERDLKGQILGDFLVRLGSATGRHRDQGKRLPVPPDHCRVFHERSHFDLLSDPRVHEQIVEWFGR